MQRATQVLLTALLIVVALSLVASVNPVGTGSCKKKSGTALDATGDDHYFGTAGKIVSAQLEPDTTAAGATIRITVYDCSDEDTDTCLLHQWDTDSDGIPDTSVMDGSSFGARNLPPFQSNGITLFDTTTAAGASETPKLTVCTRGT